MPRPTSNDIELDKLARFSRCKKAIASLEKQQQQLLKLGELSPKGAWVARYQVRQNKKKYWYYKLQVPQPYFQCVTSDKLSKYKHLGKAGTTAYIDAVMSVMRRSIWNESQKVIDSLDDCLLDISSGSEIEEEEQED